MVVECWLETLMKEEGLVNHKILEKKDNDDLVYAVQE